MSLFINLNPNSAPKPSFFKPISQILFFSNPKRLVFTLNCSRIPFRTLQTLHRLKPHVLSNRRPILTGWLCSFVSVASLSKIVPDLGKFASLAGGLDAAGLGEEGLHLGVLVWARILGGYGQQAFLWEASLRIACDVRVRVFRSVLERTGFEFMDLGVFQGREDDVLAGDVAYRITAEASEVAATVYALLNTTLPSILQLSAMARQMLAISPVLSLISAMIIPSLALVVAYLGEERRGLSWRGAL